MKPLPMISEPDAPTESDAPVKDAVLEPPPDATTVNFDVRGMTCASCARRVENALRSAPGVANAGVNLATERATVHLEHDASPDHLVDAVAAAGYELVPRGDHGMHGSGGHEHEEATPHAVRDAGRRALIAALLTMPVVVLGMAHEILHVPEWVQLVLITPVQFWAAWPFLRMAAKQARHLAANMDTLIALGTLSAYSYSLYALFAGGHVYFETAGVIVTFLLLGRYLELRSRSRASAAIKGLLELAAVDAIVIRDGVETRVPVEEIVVGDVMRIRPGDKVPTDAVIEEGSSAFDEAMMTGEPVPAEKGLGDEIFGATINTTGSVLARATRVGSETALSQIIALVEEAQTRKAPIERMADRISAIFVPIVIVIAIATLAGWIATGHSVEQGVIAAVAVLIIACPCAMGLATPAAVMVGSGRGAQLGILIRGGDVLERTHGVDVVVLDKTGTLTKGEMGVVAVLPEADAGLTSDELLRLAASAESPSEHPIARAIVRAAGEKGLSMSPALSFASQTGAGVDATVDGRFLSIGSPARMRSLGVVPSPETHSKITQFQENGHTLIGIAEGARPLGVIAVADEVKATAKEAVATLRSLGLDVVLVTGDNAAAAAAVAERTGIERVLAEVAPDGKVAEVKRLQAEGHRVAVVGDGINDAPALAQADLGIAIGTGAGVALEAADLTLVGGDPLLAPRAIALARRTLRIIKQNLFWAFFYNTVMIPAAMLGLLDPMIAAGAMAFSSVSVVLNALRLRR
ncbi:MAG TPA: heavy metal translocating P-type ATPase [Actinomycetota bacterium]|nr:heavy metal translocating P-type ATPase [Actinomycetota bacterium]